MELTTLIERTQQIRDALPAVAPKQRLGHAATQLDLATYNQSRVGLLNEALLKFTTTLYNADGSGRLANLDPRTHRILIPKPWGKAGWRQYEMRDWEATVLRKILLTRCEGRGALFDYGAGQWFLNLADHPRLDIALLHWKRQPVNLREWYAVADGLRQQARDRMDRRRGK